MSSKQQQQQPNKIKAYDTLQRLKRNGTIAGWDQHESSMEKKRKKAKYKKKTCCRKCIGSINKPFIIIMTILTLILDIILIYYFICHISSEFY